MKNILTLIICITLSAAAMACGNEYGYTLQGVQRYTEYFYLSEHMKWFNSADIDDKMKKLGELVQNGKADYKTWSDIALNLMKLGKADSSVKILKPLAQEHPKEYNIIANLGTAYELTGELDSALKYISQDLVINPNSHWGSEWIHVKILEAKIKARKNPRWFELNSIVNIDSFINPPDSAKRIQVANKFYYDMSLQLRTRAPFTPPPDKVMTNLLVSLGDFCTRAETYENALLAYTYALRYLDPDNLRGQTKIEDKIRMLNFRRDSLPNHHELPEMFMYMMKQSKISPTVLLMGIDTYANRLDSLDNIKYMNRDSIQVLKAQLDSLKSTSAQQTESGVTISKDSMKYLFLIAGLVLGAALVWLLKGKK